MPAMSLREQIARRLASVKWPVLSTCRETVADMEVDASQGNMATWGDVADECIRQMTWARSEGMDGDRDKPYEVTAAPEGWKP